ncbi:hypothetical protein [Neobacillus massiliamazoniensis]|nr:hypothetical protein [Neobacillus massiliamazoniensis]
MVERRVLSSIIVLGVVRNFEIKYFLVALTGALVEEKLIDFNSKGHILVIPLKGAILEDLS